MELLKEFKKYSKKDWLNEIKKDKPDQFEQIQTHSYQNKIVGLSFASLEDRPNLESASIDNALTNQWKIVSKIDEFSLSRTKEFIDYSLQHGAEIIQLKSRHLINEFDRLFVLKGVFLDMIELCIEVNNIKEAEQMKGLSPAMTKFLLNRSDVKDFSRINEEKQFFIQYFLDTTDLDSIKNQLELIQQDAINNNSVTKKFILQFSHEFLFNIAATRAIKNLLSSKKIMGLFEIQIHPNCITSNIHENQINFSSIALSASIAGSDQIYIPSYDIFEPIKNKINLRNSLHLHHILKLESNMHQVHDPSSGSYYIEDLSMKIKDYLMSTE